MTLRKQRNLIGKKFGKLLAIEMLGNNGGGHYKTKVRCDCGNEFVTRDTELIHNRRTQCKICGCNFTKHRKTNTRLFNIWQSMKQRCSNKNNQDYYNYGARGIKVCDEWKNDFMIFYNWAIDNGYQDNLTIDRIDYNGNYEPSNCRWATNLQQANNKKNNVYIVYKNKKYTIAELARKYNLEYETFRYRIHHGWDIEKAIKIPAKSGRN